MTGASIPGQSRIPATPFVVHVTADHPDDIEPVKTPVIQRLVELASVRFDQKVISLNRVAPPKASWAWPDFALDFSHESDTLDTAIYRAPPAGVHHRRMLMKLGEALAERLSTGRKPDVLVGHKLTVEGIAVHRAAQLLGVPYALSIQGNTDARILRMRPDLHRHFSEIFHQAEVVFPFTPWALRAVTAKLGERSGSTMMLPCPLARDTIIPPKADGEGLICAFHLRNYKLKNLPRLASGLDLARTERPDLTLAIIGGGSPEIERKVRALPGDGLQFEGALDNADIAARVNNARGFVMPSQRESFGLVFIEALFAGTPIAYPAGTAVDGYFDDCPFALRVDAADTRAIADAMIALDREEAELKTALAEWQGSPAAVAFTRDAIGKTFINGLSLAAGFTPTIPPRAAP